MPFKSEAQRRFMHAKHPQIAKRWEKHTPKNAKLPEKVDESMHINQEIARISQLLEDIPPSGGTSHMTGGSTAQMAMMVPPDITTVVSEPAGYGDTSEPEEPDFSELELRLAHRFIELVGGAERARDLINKCDECEDCLGLVDDDDEVEADSIEGVAAIIPSDADLPTPRGMDISSLYNPNAISGPFAP